MKKFLAVCFAAMLIPFSANATCTQVTQLDENQLCMNRGGGEVCVQFSSLQTGNKNNWAVQLSNAFQAFMETRIPLIEFDIADEARFVDPHREDFYHGDVNGTHHHDPLLDTYLIARCDVFDITWNQQQQQFEVTVRNARRTHTPEGDLIP